MLAYQHFNLMLLRRLETFKLGFLAPAWSLLEEVFMVPTVTLLFPLERVRGDCGEGHGAEDLTTTMMWRRSWRVWRSVRRDGWALLQLCADVCTGVGYWCCLWPAGGPACRWSSSSCSRWTHGALTHFSSSFCVMSASPAHTCDQTPPASVNLLTHYTLRSDFLSGSVRVIKLFLCLSECFIQHIWCTVVIQSALHNSQIQ